MSRTSKMPRQRGRGSEDEILDQATAARSITELKIEIETLKNLESLALAVRRSGADTKWRELASLLGAIFTTADGIDGWAGSLAPGGNGAIPPPTPSPHQKLVVFTEHRDTLNYLENRITTLLGRPESVVAIHGGMGREDRVKARRRSATTPRSRCCCHDAAGEGINLQRAHLMVNLRPAVEPQPARTAFRPDYRIRADRVCHLWNLVADETREDVYRRLLDKLEGARKALGGHVFDVLGKIQFGGRPCATC